MKWSITPPTKHTHAHTQYTHILSQSLIHLIYRTRLSLSSDRSRIAHTYAHANAFLSALSCAGLSYVTNHIMHTLPHTHTQICMMCCNPEEQLYCYPLGVEEKKGTEERMEEDEKKIVKCKTRQRE